jgi:DNA-binding response OmpR family regulator
LARIRISPQEISDVVRFADFEANLRSRELFRNGRKVKVPEQSFAVLVMLLEKTGDGFFRIYEPLLLFNSVPVFTRKVGVTTVLKPC